jgi:hypothetical protein
MVTLLTDALRQIFQLANAMTFIIVLVPYCLTLSSMIILPLRSHFGRHAFWGGAFSNAVLSYWLSIEAASSDARFGFGVVISFAIILLFLICFAIGASITAFRRRRKAVTLRSANVLFAIIAYVPAPLILLFPLGIFARWNGIFAFGLLVLLAATLASLAFLAAPGRRKSPPFDRFGLSCLTLSATLTLSLAIAFASATAVWAEAERTAGRNPYCLQSGDQPVTTMLDASILTFREPRYDGKSPRYLRNHGLLIVDAPEGRRVFNWSYRKTKFVPESLYDFSGPTEGPEIVCIPSLSLKPE